MEYSIRELSDLAGVSARTLRYYGEIGLLRPLYANEAGVRYYGEDEVSLLQQILFYRERGFELKQIRQIIYQKDFDRIQALEEHLLELEKERMRVDGLIKMVTTTLASMKGECEMSDKEKFEAFKKHVVEENENLYGEEIRKSYGTEAVEGANQKILNMSQQDWKEFKELEKEIKERLQEGVRKGVKGNSQEAEEIADLHRKWLCMTWKNYTKEAHRGVAEMYVLDQRFRDYYDQEVPGCAELLRDAVVCWVQGK